MRRLSLLLSVVLVTLVGVAGLWGAGAIAQEATPEASAGEIPPLLVAWAEAWTSHDPEPVIALYAEDAVYEEIPTGSVSQGHDEIRAFVEATHAAFPNIEVTPRTGFQAEGWAVLEGDFAGETPEGQSFSVPFVVVMELDGETIRRSTDYFDLNAVFTQIGAAPAAAEATPAA